MTTSLGSSGQVGPGTTPAGPPPYLVAVARAAKPQYPARPPFHPPEAYPELATLGLVPATEARNDVYPAVRDCLRRLGMDAARYGTSEWNPLGEVVNPGDRVLVKPNWVSHKHELNDSWESVITHGAVLRAVIDYVQLALAGRGEICLADGPMLNTDFDLVCERSGVSQVKQHYDELPRALGLEVIDLRSVFFVTRDDVVVRRHALPGDPRGGVTVDLKERSEFYAFAGEGRYYGADYDTSEVNQHHTGRRQEYRLSGTAMQSQVIIDVPKLKTHHKVGVTLALKGVVGLNTDRNWLPHRTQGTPQQGGDQFAESGWRQRLEHHVVRRFEQAALRFPGVVSPIYRVAKRAGRLVFGRSHETVRGGGWHGNDTLWRMVLDINRALQYADAAGDLHEWPQRRRFCVVDGIIAGEGTGPVFPDARRAGVIVAGPNPLIVDTVCAELMGFDSKRIPVLDRALRRHEMPLAPVGYDEIRVVSNEPQWSGAIDNMVAAAPFEFKAPLGWEGEMERTSQVAEGEQN